ncbi:MAG: phosphatase PAP2 family protein [Clostridia bacterium]|nr:phosphatase PAP2 family protein [Clostridia bacterium]
MNLKKAKTALWAGVILVALFILWTVLIQTVDVRPAGESGTAVGLATLNCRFHQLTGVHMALYTATDWLGLVPVGVCLIFAAMGAAQLVRRKSLRKVDGDLLLLGVYYAAVIAGYLLFEGVPVNYRPILIDGRMEASYPSSTTLLTLGVMPTLVFQAERRMKRSWGTRAVGLAAVVFSLLMVAGRLISGVHWITDIVGGVLLSGGGFQLYRAGVLLLVPSCKDKGGL